MKKPLHLQPLLQLFIFFSAFISLPHLTAFAQVKLGDGNGLPNPSAVLELESTNKGFLPPRMTTEQRDKIESPAHGMVIYNTSLNSIQLYKPSGWTSLIDLSASLYPQLPYEDILAIPSPKMGALAYDLTTGCLRSYNGKRWLCSYQKPDEPFSQITAWREGSYGEDKGLGISILKNGNIRINGSFTDNISIGGTYLSASGLNHFTAEYNAEGVGQSAQVVPAQEIRLHYDAQGNRYEWGYFSGNITFGHITLTAASGMNNFYIVKYNATGDVLWANSGSGDYNFYFSQPKFDAHGNVFVSGEVKGLASFGNLTIYNGGHPTIFLVKYNSGGIPQWVKQFGSSSQYNSSPKFEIDTNNNIYLTHRGYWRHWVSIYIGKYNNDGEAIWHKSVDSAGGYSTYEGYLDNLNNGSLKVDEAGNTYASLSFIGSVSIENLKKFSGSGDKTVNYLIKYAPNGNQEWANEVPSTIFDTDSKGALYFIGSFTGHTYIGATTLSSSGSSDIFVAKYRE